MPLASPDRRVRLIDICHFQFGFRLAIGLLSRCIRSHYLDAFGIKICSFQNILPAPLIALEKNGSQDIYIAPNAVEFISQLGTAYTSYYDSKGFNWKKYAGAKVCQISHAKS